MDAQFTNTLDPQQFSFTRESDMEPSSDGHSQAVGQGGLPNSGVSLRTTKPTWNNKKNSTLVSRNHKMNT
jgi:syntaxin-binding protein 1